MKKNICYKKRYIFGKSAIKCYNFKQSAIKVLYFGGQKSYIFIVNFSKMLLKCYKFPTCAIKCYNFAIFFFPICGNSGNAKKIWTHWFYLSYKLRKQEGFGIRSQSSCSFNLLLASLKENGENRRNRFQNKQGRGQSLLLLPTHWGSDTG